MRVGSNRKVASILVAVVATVGLWGTPAHAASSDGDYTSPIWNRFATRSSTRRTPTLAVDCAGVPGRTRSSTSASASGDVDCTVISERGWWRSPPGSSAGPTPSPPTPTRMQAAVARRAAAGGLGLVDGRRQESSTCTPRETRRSQPARCSGPGERTTYYEILRAR